MTPNQVIAAVCQRIDDAFGRRADMAGRLYAAFRPDVHRIVREAMQPIAGTVAALSNWAKPVRTESLQAVTAALSEAYRAKPSHALAQTWRRMEIEAEAELAERGTPKQPARENVVDGDGGKPKP